VLVPVLVRDAAGKIVYTMQANDVTARASYWAEPTEADRQVLGSP
jgi:hypothetical protein